MKPESTTIYQSTAKNILCLRFVLLLGLLSLLNTEILSQCTNTNKYPTSNIQASIFNEVQTITIAQWAGQYFVIQGLVVGRTYQFSSSSAGDYITIRDKDGLAVLGSGNSPFAYTVVGDDIVSVHINLSSPLCGTQNINRTTSSQCTTCPPVPSNVGIATNSPKSSLDVNGKLKLSDDPNLPIAGMIRWNAGLQDFEGYDGNAWRSFTKSAAPWGNLPKNEITERQKAVASDGAASDSFGYSVSIAGDYAVIGAARDDIGANVNQGSAYIFKRSGSSWTQEVKLTASDGTANDYFGTSVSVSGDYAVIGAYGDDIGANTNQGSAYIFKRSGSLWIQEAKLTASDGALGDYFGFSVSISGDYAVIGSGADIGANTDQGAAYIFNRIGSSWIQQAKLTASDGAAYDYFGISVSISGDYALIGAYYDDIGANIEQGSAYIFNRIGNSWTQQAKLTANDGAATDNFGNSVSLFEDYAVIGAHQSTIGPNGTQGSAYIFKRSGSSWPQEAKLTASDGATGDRFGSSVSLSGDYAVIGAYQSTIGPNPWQFQGSAYIFKRSSTSWTQEAKIKASDGAAGDYLGYSVSIYGDYVVIGAIGANGSQGSVYFLNK